MIEVMLRASISLIIDCASWSRALADAISEERNPAGSFSGGKGKFMGRFVVF